MRSISSAFNLRINNYRGADGKTFFAAVQSPAMPNEIRGLVSSIVGLSDVHRFASYIKILPKGSKNSSGGSGPGGALANTNRP